MAVDVDRHADLLEPAGVHQGDAVGHRHRLLLVVRDVDRGDAERLLQLADLAAHADPQRARRDCESGSSNSRTCGRMTRARAMATRCSWPPDELVRPARAVAASLDQGFRSPRSLLWRRHLDAPPCTFSPWWRCCRRAIEAVQWRSSGNTMPDVPLIMACGVRRCAARAGSVIIPCRRLRQPFAKPAIARAGACVLCRAARGERQQR